MLPKVWLEEFGVPIRRWRFSFLESRDSAVRACIVVSKRFAGRTPLRYWYAYLKYFHEVLGQAGQGYFVPACMERLEGYAIPYQKSWAEHLDMLGKTRRAGTLYWHIHLHEHEGEIVGTPAMPARVFSLRCNCITLLF